MTADVSADLVELGRTPVAVVCAGIKSILDIPKTLEFLETQVSSVHDIQNNSSAHSFYTVWQAVPVVGYQSDQFPAFFTTDSGVKAHLRRDSARACAQLIHESQALDLPNGFVIAVPNPKPVPKGIIDQAIEVWHSTSIVRSVGVSGALHAVYHCRKHYKKWRNSTFKARPLRPFCCNE